MTDDINNGQLMVNNYSFNFKIIHNLISMNFILKSIFINIYKLIKNSDISRALFK